MSGFGSPEQQRAFILRSLAGGATPEAIAHYLNLDADIVRDIANSVGLREISERLDRIIERLDRRGDA